MIATPIPFFRQSSNNTASYRQREPQFSRHLPRSPQPAAGWPLAPAVPGSSRLPRLQLPTGSRPGPPPPPPSPSPAPSRRATGCKSNQPHRQCLQNHSRRSALRARAPSSRAGSPGRDHKVPFSPPGSCAEERGLGRFGFSPRPGQGPRSSTAPCRLLSGPPLSFHKACTTGK